MATVVLAGENHLMIAFQFFTSILGQSAARSFAIIVGCPNISSLITTLSTEATLKRLWRVSDQITTSDDVAFFHSTCSMHLTLQMCRSILLRAHGCCARVLRSGLRSLREVFACWK